MDSTIESLALNNRYTFLQYVYIRKHICLHATFLLSPLKQVYPFAKMINNDNIFQTSILSLNNHQCYDIRTGYTKKHTHLFLKPFHINIFAHIVVSKYAFWTCCIEIEYKKCDACIVFGHLLKLYGLKPKFMVFIL